MKVACGSHTNVYLPFFRVTVHVELPVFGVLVLLFTPGPLRWKLWRFDLSLILNVYVPAFSFLTAALPCFSVIVKPGPTVPVSVGDEAKAEGTMSAAAIAASATSF